MRQWLFCLLMLLGGTPALAQSAYVAVGIGADVFRARHVDAGGFDGPSVDGEAIALSLRAGTAVTDRWGVEMEFTRAAEIEREVRQGFPVPLLRSYQVSATGGVGPGVVLPADTIRTVFPIFESTTRVSRRNATLDAVLWVAQPVGSRVDLVYLGGVAFTRATETLAFQFTQRTALAPIVVPNSTQTTTYGTGPVAGLEARIQLTAHVVLMPGIRVHGVSDTGNVGGGWLLRPAVALGWRF